MQDKVGATSYVSAGFAAVLGWNLNDWALAVGIATALFTAWVNWYYKCKEREDRRGLKN